MKKIYGIVVLAVSLLLAIIGIGLPPQAMPDGFLPEEQQTAWQTDSSGEKSQEVTSDFSETGEIEEDGSYTSKEDVGLYIHVYEKLPENFITKNEARKLGWEGGSLEPFAPGKCIGGDRFGNYEELLPESGGRQYFECDIDTLHAKSRGPKRIVFSNDGLIFYTEDHYQSFEQMW